MTGILEAIDNALRDPTVSSDAMRWIPDSPRVICDSGSLLQILAWHPQMRPSTYADLPDGHYWIES